MNHDSSSIEHNEMGIESVQAAPLRPGSKLQVKTTPAASVDPTFHHLAPRPVTAKPIELSIPPVALLAPAPEKSGTVALQWDSVVEDTALKLKLLAVNPLDIVTAQIERDRSPLSCLLNLDLGEKFQTHLPTNSAFASLLTRTVTLKDYATLTDLPLGTTAFIYILVSETDIVNKKGQKVNIRTQERILLLSMHLGIHIKFANFLIATSVAEKANEFMEPPGRVENGRQDLFATHLDDDASLASEIFMDLLHFPMGLTKFVRHQALLPFAVAFLRTLFMPTIRGDQANLILMLTKSFDISDGFARFLLFQFEQEAPVSWL